MGIGAWAFVGVDFYPIMDYSPRHLHRWKGWHAFPSPEFRHVRLSMAGEVTPSAAERGETGCVPAVTVDSSGGSASRSDADAVSRGTVNPCEVGSFHGGENRFRTPGTPDKHKPHMAGRSDERLHIYKHRCELEWPVFPLP